uniref:RRM domain-containing protein n=1 Tax=Strigamia maritima TaxID=126957 RepID=T1INY3_STRMM
MSTQVFIGCLSHEVCTQDIEHFLRGYGHNHRIILKKGFGFIQFANHRNADDAIYDLNGRNLFGQRVVMEFARRGRRRETNRDRGLDERTCNNFNFGCDFSMSSKYRLIVKNLSSSVNWRHLKDYLRQAGEVVYVHKQSHFVGIVDFATETGMETAIEQFDNTELNGCRLKVFKENAQRSHKDSDFRSRPHSNNYSRPRSSNRSRSPLKSRGSLKEISQVVDNKLVENSGDEKSKESDVIEKLEKKIDDGKIGENSSNEILEEVIESDVIDKFEDIISDRKLLGEKWQCEIGSYFGKVI